MKFLVTNFSLKSAISIPKLETSLNFPLIFTKYYDLYISKNCSQQSKL